MATTLTEQQQRAFELPQMIQKLDQQIESLQEKRDQLIEEFKSLVGGDQNSVVDPSEATVKQIILKIITGNGGQPVTSEQLVDQLIKQRPATESTIKTVISRLVKSGEIERVAMGTYRVPE